MMSFQLVDLLVSSTAIASYMPDCTMVVAGNPPFHELVYLTTNILDPFAFQS